MNPREKLFTGRVKDPQTQRVLESHRAVLEELQAVIRALRIGVGWDLVGETEVDAATTEIALNGDFNGDRDGEYRIDLELLTNGALGAADIRLKPNRTTAAAFESTTLSTAGLTATVTDEAGSWTLVSAVSGSTHIAGRAFIMAHRRTFGRWFDASGAFGTPSSAMRNWFAAGHWDDSTTNITSLSIDATVANKILAGSMVRVYKRGIP